MSSKPSSSSSISKTRKPKKLEESDDEFNDIVNFTRFAELNPSETAGGVASSAGNSRPTKAIRTLDDGKIFDEEDESDEVELVELTRPRANVTGTRKGRESSRTLENRGMPTAPPSKHSATAIPEMIEEDLTDRPSRKPRTRKPEKPRREPHGLEKNKDKKPPVTDHPSDAASSANDSDSDFEIIGVKKPSIAVSSKAHHESSSSKVARKPEAKPDPKPKSSSLLSFFATPTTKPEPSSSLIQMLRQSSQSRLPSQSQPSTATKRKIDIVEIDDASEETPRKKKARVELPATGRDGDPDEIQPASPIAIKSKVKSRSSRDSKPVGAPLQPPVETALWVDKHEPLIEKQLCISAVKQKEIKEAFLSSLSGHLRLIVLNGPPGCGKSAAIKVLAKSADADLVQFSNPVRFNSLYLENNPNPSYTARQTDRFDDGDNAVDRSNLFQTYGREPALAPVLNFIQSMRYESVVSASPSTADNHRKTVYLIDDVPYIHTPSQREQLQTAIQRHVDSPSAPPLIVIISDANAGSGYFEIQRLLPSSILNSSFVRSIRVQPVTENSMKRCLARIISDEAMAISDDQLAKVISSSDGDIRNAINSLQFLAVHDSSAFKPRAGSASELARDCSKVPVGRDISFSLFHAIGKIVHNKRRLPEASDSASISEVTQPSMPNLLMRAPMKTDPDIIFNNVHVPTPIFNDYLHENCYQFFGEIAECASAASYLSDSDVLFAELDSEYSVERAQLGRYAWEVSARGLLFSNCHKVNLKWHPMCKPYVNIVKKALDQNLLLVQSFESAPLAPGLRRAAPQPRLSPQITDAAASNIPKSISNDGFDLSVDYLPYLALIGKSQPQFAAPRLWEFVKSLCAYSSMDQVQYSHMNRWGADGAGRDRQLDQFESFFQEFHARVSSAEHERQRAIAEQARVAAANAAALALDDIEEV